MSQSQPLAGAPSALILDLHSLRAGLTGELAAISLVEALRRQAAGIAAARGIRVGDTYRDNSTGLTGTVAYFLASGEAVLSFGGPRLAVRLEALEPAGLVPEPELDLGRPFDPDRDPPEALIGGPTIELPSDCEAAS